MTYRLSKIYTRTGDEGYTTLGDNRLSKDDLLVEAVGTLDELNSVIGFVISLGINNQEIATYLTQIQNELFDLGGELHLPIHQVITKEKISSMEQMLDSWNATLPPLKEFLLPRGNSKSTACHMARTVCRRAERSLVRLHRHIPLSNTEMLRYLNRLSDLLFVTTRLLAQESQETELLWEHERKKK